MIAAAERAGFSQPMIQDFVYERALTIPSDGPVWTETSIDSRAESTSFRLQSTGMEADGSWHLNASGTVHGGPGPLPPALPGHRMRAGHEIAPDQFYRFLDRVGLSYGAAFRGIRRLWQDHDQVFAEVALPAGLDTAGYQIHPAFLDACLHVYPALIQRYGQFDGVPSAEVGAYVPITIDAFHLYEPKVERAWVHGIVVDREADEAQLKLDIRAYGEDGRPIAVLRGLTVRRVVNEMSVPAEEAGFGALLYTLDWREIPDPAPAPRSPRHWYIIADQTGVGERLGHLLAAQGASAVVQTSDLPVIDRTLDEAPECAVGLVYLRALDAPPTDLAGLAPASQTNALVCGGCLDLAKALDRMRDRFRDPPRLWLVTRGAEHALAQTPLWGLGRSFALEYPEMWGGLIDLPAEAASGIAADLLLRELQAGDGEDQISYRAGKRLVPRLVRLASSRGTAPNLAAEATYWIVGGLGRLGLQTAAALIEAGAQHLVLTGRSEPDSAGNDAIARLRQNAEVLFLPADVADPAQVDAALAQIRATMPPLRGVIHAAAAFEDALLANASWELFERVLRPKLAGAWNLHRATLELDLDFFVLFSTVLSLWGAAGQGAYTAANSFLDALAHHRRAQGLPATVFNWGPWEDAGRWGAVGAALWKQRGTVALPPKTCLKILLSHLEDGPAQIVATDTSWLDFLTQFAKAPALYRELALTAAPAATVSTAGSARQHAEDTIATHAGQVLGLDGRTDSARPLNELGLELAARCHPGQSAAPGARPRRAHSAAAKRTERQGNRCRTLPRTDAHARGQQGGAGFGCSYRR